MDYHQSIAATCEQTIAALSAVLSAHGYRLERSFDLRSALNDQPDCPCPHHGTAQCTCQYVVLLVYEEAASTSPVPLTAHECDGVTRVQMIVNQSGERLSWPLLAALDEALSNVTAMVSPL